MLLTMEGLTRRIALWVIKSFGEANLYSRRERAMRVVEEAIELGQAEKLTLDDVKRIAERTFSRPPGTVENEVAGVQLTLAALCYTAKIKPMDAAYAELVRIESLPTEHFREKHQAKVAAGTGAPLSPR